MKSRMHRKVLVALAAALSMVVLASAPAGADTHVVTAGTVTVTTLTEEFEFEIGEEGDPPPCIVEPEPGDATVDVDWDPNSSGTVDADTLITAINFNKGFAEVAGFGWLQLDFELIDDDWKGGILIGLHDNTGFYDASTGVLTQNASIGIQVSVLGDPDPEEPCPPKTKDCTFVMFFGGSVFPDPPLVGTYDGTTAILDGTSTVIHYLGCEGPLAPLGLALNNADVDIDGLTFA